jgi:sigma-E factor negative regulatory protein RseC
MIEQRAIILSLADYRNFKPVNEDTSVSEQSVSLATLEIERTTACGLCGQTRGCGNGIWGKIFAHQATAFKAKNPIGAKVGDSVIVGIDEQALLKGAALLYLLPLATMFISMLLANQLNASHASVLVGAAVGLLLGLVWLKGHVMSSAHHAKQQAVILRLADCGQTSEIKFS